METIRVNMTPCDDVQTIHASQGDTEAREWGFALHNNGDVIDSSEITDQIVFKAYKGGTEELLPSSLMNGFVDLGSLAWTYMPNNYFRSTAVISDAKIPSNENTVANIFCSILKPNTANNVYANNEGIAIDGTGRIRIYYNDMPTDATSFAQAMQGVLLWYEKSDSTPTTTPIKADIKYPQGLLTNQEFTYRESPTEEDGLAFIKTIKGQTIKWNQLATLPNSGSRNGVAITNNGDGSLTINGQATANVNDFGIYAPYISNHVYYIANIPTGVNIYNQLFYETTWRKNLDLRERPMIRKITDTSTDANRIYFSQFISNGTSFDNVTYYPMVFDLTMMFGETKADEILAMETAQSGSGIAYFKSLFPLDYYPYNSGSLIPFMGNGIKTVGKNQLNLGESKSATANGVTASYDASTQKVTLSGTNTKTDSAYILINFTPSAIPKFKIGETYVVSASSQIPTNTYFNLVYRDTNNALQGLSLTQIETRRAWRFTVPSNYSTFNSFQIGILKEARQLSGEFGIQLEFGSTATSYEPYTESILNLPISTYFPSGMKSAGNVYDELTESKAITRIGAVDMGSLTWEYRTTGSIYAPYFYTAFTGIKPNGNPNVRKANILCSKYSTAYRGQDVFIDKTICADGSSTELTQLQIKDSSFTDATALKNSLQGQYLYYEMITETETSFLTASLVTENAEIPLSNDDGVLIGKCTEELSAEPGFHDAKIKLSDSDGECYSNKIQLHIERSPQ